MTALQFIFYVGWMKVAESLMNPLGEDDDDFECNFLVDRNLSVGLAIVDECYGDLPPQQKDVFWSSEVAEPLYSADTAVKPMNPQIGSAAQYEPREEEVVMMPHVDVDELDNISVDDPEVFPLYPLIATVEVVRVCRAEKVLCAYRDGRKLSRPNRLDISQMSLNIDNKPTVELVGESSLDILGDLADEAARNSMLLTPNGG
ncbi:unnamed protein product [Nippostrongylus brasiliensis]|uniref:Bestrophin homolog n=1 Tax=Nippostrongylus brasiliensis TaxID=27835 RepID=A0A0N4XLE6_NIPBR|nr:unnamed protein product [Nippostrongylus brasiliensis]